VIFDGAMGTNLQLANLSADDFGGPSLEGCNEVLVRTRPDAVEAVHRSFLQVGVDAIETDTFGAFSVVLAEYGIDREAYELNATAADLARRVADSFELVSNTPEMGSGSASATGKAAGSSRAGAEGYRYVAGSIGPGTKFPTLGQISYRELVAAYEVQARGLLDGGVDLFLIETVFDLLQAKSAINGCRDAMRHAGKDLPIQVQVTIELTGRMLPGTEIGAALVALDGMRPDVIGMNCATGPAEMRESLRHLSEHSRMPVSVLPNAGLPSVVNGAMHYDLTPAELARFHQEFVQELGVSVIGGCCGTTPAHLAAVVEACRGLTPTPRNPSYEAGAASLYSAVPFTQDTSFLVIGERTNANGSKRFREAMLGGDWDTVTAMAKEQVAEGAHLIDVCVDYTGADGVADMEQVARRLATQSSAPIVIDSTEAPVVRTALEWLGGRPVLNSVNLEDGAGEGNRLDSFLSLAREFGAAVVCTCIDEEGQARTAPWKLRAARQIHDLAIERYGLEPSDLLIDPLVLPLSTGMEESRGDGIATIEGIRRIKAELPGVHTVIGLSNVSFGLNPPARQALNSVFLYECMQAGLDAAIVHPGRIVPLQTIDDEVRQACQDLIYDRRAGDYDPLAKLIACFEGVSSAKRVEVDKSDWPVERRLEQRIIDGDRNGLEQDLAEALAGGREALSIVNDILLSGMKTVGDLFGSGAMQLPFVLASAETMKAAVSFLEPRMPRASQGGKGTVVLATVKGDVHDIGKNLVDIILTNNGYKVLNLGIKVGVNEILEAAQQNAADAIGMSGLLVKSTLVMRENLEEMNRRGASSIPVLLGGAALTRTYVERDLRKVYEGRLFYGRDAFEGLHTMDKLREMAAAAESDPSFGREPAGRNLGPRRSERLALIDRNSIPKRSPEIDTTNQVPEPPFCGSRVAKGIGIDDISPYLNETSLFRNQWGYRPEKKGDSREDDKSFKQRVRKILREALAEAKASGVLVPQVVWGYYPANGDGDDLVLWEDRDRRRELTRFEFPRQKESPWYCIADFFRSVDSGDEDWAAFFVVTMGSEVSEVAARLFAENRYREYVRIHGLGVEMTEGLAEYWHRRIREEWGFAGEDGPSIAGLFRQQYRGGRYSWGYPACPNLEDNAKVVDLLEGKRIGVQVTEGFQLDPEQTTLAIVCHHPQAKYFVA